MSLDEDMDAFDRAFGVPAEGQPMVSEDKKRDLVIDDESALERAMESDAVDVDNSDVETEESSLWNRFFSEPYERAVQRQAATFERMGNTMQAGSAQGIQAALADPEVLKQQYQERTNLPSVLLQTVTTPLRMLFDSASEMFVFGVEKGVAMMPEGLKEGAAEQFNDLMQTEGGQMAMAAAGEGLEAWQKFEETFPNEAANLVAILDLGFTKGTGALVKQPIEPMKIEKVGMVTETKPLKGRDSDVYNILFNTGKKTPEQVKNTTDPQGITGKQQQLASPEELEVVGLAKTAGVAGNLTAQGNYNKLSEYYDKLEQSLMAAAGKRESKINLDELNTSVQANVKAAFDEMVTTNPKLMGSPAAQKEVAGWYKEFLSIFSEQDGTLKGLRSARTLFDNRATRMGADLSGESVTARNLAAMAVRTGVNRSLIKVVPEAEGIFEKMSKLSPAMTTVNNKASVEAATAFGRFLQKTGIADKAGKTGASQLNVVNAGFVLGYTVGLSPVWFIRSQLRKAKPADYRAKLAYVKRDIFGEIKNAIKSTKDPVKRSMLQRDSKEIYVILNAAFKELEDEYNEQQEAGK